jgi:hypothetical protein
MSGERVIISGPMQRTSLIGAILASGWAGSGREVVIAADGPVPAGKMITRQGHQRLHAQIGLSEEAIFRRCDPQPAFAVEMPIRGGTASLPFAPFGVSRGGVEFHHFWVRAATDRSLPELMEFSPAIALNTAGGLFSPALLAQLRLPFGLAVNSGSYCELLLGQAKQNSARIVTSVEAQGIDADLVIDCNAAEATAGWSGRKINVAADCDLFAIEWQICVNAARRLIGLAGALANSEYEQREYTRLTLAELERVADMHALLHDYDPRETTRPALRRKVELFTACGRIPTEDFEFFSPPEWLAGLWARGLRPRRFDRMARALHDDELMRWLTTIHKEIRQLSSAGASQ